MSESSDKKGERKKVKLTRLIEQLRGRANASNPL